MHKIFTSALVLMLTFTCVSTEAGVFGWLKKKELQLSPVVHGQILLHGQPVSGITVIRDLNYGDELFTDKHTTDPEGRFSFPPKIIRTRDSMFDTNIRHGLFIEQDSKIIRIFSISSLNTLNFKSFNTLLNSMTCELTDSELGFDLEPDPLQPGVYLGAISRCSFADESVVTNKESME